MSDEKTAVREFLAGADLRWEDISTETLAAAGAEIARFQHHLAEAEAAISQLVDRLTPFKRETQQ